MHALAPLDAAGRRSWCDYTREAGLPRAGQAFGKRTPAVAGGDPARRPRGGRWPRSRWAPRAVRLRRGRARGRPVEVTARGGDRHGDPARGLGGGHGRGETVALDLHVTPSCAPGWRARWCGWMQEARKNDRPGGHRPDHAALVGGRRRAGGALAGRALIADEVLAETLEPGQGAPRRRVAADGGGCSGRAAPGLGRAPSGTGRWHEHGDADLGLRFWIRRPQPAPRYHRPSGTASRMTSAIPPSRSAVILPTGPCWARLLTDRECPVIPLHCRSHTCWLTRRHLAVFRSPISRDHGRKGHSYPRVTRWVRGAGALLDLAGPAGGAAAFSASGDGIAHVLRGS